MGHSKNKSDCYMEGVFLYIQTFLHRSSTFLFIGQMWVIECAALQDLFFREQSRKNQSGILLHILQSPQLLLLLFFSQHDGSAGQKAAGPTEKTPVSHSVSLHVSEPTNFAHLHVRKLFDEGKFPDYRTSSSLHAQNRPLTRSDPVS